MATVEVVSQVVGSSAARTGAGGPGGHGSFNGFDGRNRSMTPSEVSRATS